MHDLKKVDRVRQLALDLPEKGNGLGDLVRFGQDLGLEQLGFKPQRAFLAANRPSSFFSASG